MESLAHRQQRELRDLSRQQMKSQWERFLRRKNLAPKGWTEASPPACHYCGTAIRPGLRLCPGCSHAVFPAGTAAFTSAPGLHNSSLPRRRILWVLILALGIMMVTAIAVDATNHSTLPRGTLGSIAKISNIRTGPATTYRIVGLMRRGEKVVIECRTGTPWDPWDKLAFPFKGNYIGATRVTSDVPPSCPMRK